MTTTYYSCDQSLFKAYRDEAKENYEENKEMVDGVQRDNVNVDDNSLKMLKFNCIMDAGVYNKDKKLYQRGYNKVMKQMFIMVEDVNTDNYVLIDTNNDYALTKNENAYITMCNHLKKEKQLLEKRHKNLMEKGYFN